MDAAQTGKFRVLKPRDHAQHIFLSAVFHFGLKSHDIKQCAQRIIPAQLHHRIGLIVRLMRIGQAHRLHWPESQCFATTFCHHFNRQAAIKISGFFARFELGFIGT